MPKKDMVKRMSLKDCREETESRRNEVLIAIRVLAKILFSGEDLKQHCIGDKLVGIGTAITECGITDEMICQAVEEIRQEMGVGVHHGRDEDKEEMDRHFGNMVPYVGSVVHETDNSPELRALRVKHAAHVVGGHAFAKKYVA